MGLLRDLFSRAKRFVEDNPSPVSYVQKQVTPRIAPQFQRVRNEFNQVKRPVVSFARQNPSPSSLISRSPRITNFASNVQNRINPTLNRTVNLYNRTANNPTIKNIVGENMLGPIGSIAKPFLPRNAGSKIVDTAKQFGKDALRSFPQAATRVGVEIGKKLGGPQEFVPKTRTQKIILGDKPVGGFKEYGQDTAQGFGIKNLPASAAIPVGIGLTAMDLTPFGAGKGKLAERLAQEGTELGVRKLLGKEALNYGDDVIKALSKEKNVNKVAGLLKNKVAPVTDALSNEAKVLTTGNGLEVKISNPRTQTINVQVGNKPTPIEAKIFEHDGVTLALYHEKPLGGNLYVLADPKTGATISSGQSEAGAILHAKLDNPAYWDKVKSVLSPTEAGATGSLRNQTGRKGMSVSDETVRSGQLSNQPIVQEESQLAKQVASPSDNLTTASKAVPYEQNIAQTGSKVNGTVRQRGFVETVKGSEKTSQKTAELVNGLYQVRNTKELAQKAQNLVKDYPETAWEVYRGSNDDKGVAVGMELMNKMAKEKNHTLEAEIAKDLAERLTKAGQTAQAASIYNRMTPEGIVRFAASEINAANKANPRLNLKLQPEDAARLREMALKVQKIGDSEQRAIATQGLIDEISKLVPTPNIQKVVTLWKAGLLTGLKTTGVNIASNVTKGVADIAKDVPAAIVDSVASLFTGQRSKTLNIRGTGGGLKEGFQKGWRYFRTGYDERNLANKFDYTKVNFGSSKFAKVLQGYEETIFRALGTEDQPFYYGAKARSLYDQAYAAAKNQKLKGQEVEKFVQNFIQDPPDDALKYAVADAEGAVFQNQTQLGKLAQGLAKHPVGEFIAPFRRTPSAVATELINYSPAGIAKAIIENVGKGRFDQRNFSQLMGKGITGTGLFAIGSALMAKGLMTLNAPTSEKERNQWELEGKIPQSIRIGGRWYKAGTLGPIGMSMLIGGYYQKAKQEEGSQVKALAAALSGAGRAVIDQSFLQGVSGLLEAINDPVRYAGNYIGNTIGSIVPTIVSDFAKAIDTTERQTKGSVFQPIASRVPWLRETLSPKVDVLGNKVPTQGFIPTMVDFTRSSKVRGDNVAQELGALNAEATPTKFTDKIKVLGQEVKLDEKQLLDLNQKTGGEVNKVLQSIMSQPGYGSLDKESKTQLIDSATKTIKDAQKASLATGGMVDSSKLTDKTLREFGKLQFEQSGQKSALINGVYYYQKENGDTGSYTQPEMEFEVRNQQMQILEENKNDFGAWTKLANEQLNSLKQQWKDAQGDGLGQLKIENKIIDLQQKMAKYSSYGGFTKGKKGKKPKALPKVSSYSGPIVKKSTAMPKVSFARRTGRVKVSGSSYATVANLRRIK